MASPTRVQEFTERERALLCEPLRLTPAQSQRLIRAAVGVDASLWRDEMAKLEAQGFTTRNPNWAQVSIEKMIPWFECKAQLVLTTGMSFCEVLELTVGDLQLSECETCLEAVAGHKLTDRCSALLEAVFPLGQLALFPWSNRTQPIKLWLRVCRNAGLLRRHPARRMRS
jgi:hypothetical protein